MNQWALVLLKWINPINKHIKGVFNVPLQLEDPIFLNANVEDLFETLLLISKSNGWLGVTRLGPNLIQVSVDSFTNGSVSLFIDYKKGTNKLELRTLPNYMTILTFLISIAFFTGYLLQKVECSIILMIIIAGLPLVVLLGVKIGEDNLRARLIVALHRHKLIDE